MAAFDLLIFTDGSSGTLFLLPHDSSLYYRELSDVRFTFDGKETSLFHITKGRLAAQTSESSDNDKDYTVSLQYQPHVLVH